MSKIPTAEDFLQEHTEISHFFDDKSGQMVCFSADVQKAMIEFAQLHVEAQLKAILENTNRCWVSDGYSTGMWQEVVDKDSIINAYPLTNIK